MSVNGQLPASDLAPIPGGRLKKGAPADSWNSMCYAYRQRTGRTPLPNGPASSYRTYGQQVDLRRYWCNQGRCGNAAQPGSSNHGWGLAVDGNGDAQNAADSLTQFGWAKRCSDAPWEAWHRRFCGSWSGPPAPAVVDPLTKYERRLVNELIGLRRRWARRPSGKRGSAEIRRASSIKKALRQQLTAIRNTATRERNGWDKARRRTRYRLIRRSIYGT